VSDFVLALGGRWGGRGGQLFIFVQWIWLICFPKEQNLDEKQKVGIKSFTNSKATTK